jgi:hypothetical protein
MIKSDFMTSRIIIAAIITMGGLSYSNLLTVTGQDPNNENSDIIFIKQKYSQYYYNWR